MSLRPEMIQSAVTFLRDQSVGSSPLAKRIAFLEAKGLTQAEVDEALRQSSAPAPSSGAYGYAPARYAPDAVRQGRDWRDWFIMSVVGGSVGYLVVALARKYLLPALQPPTESQLAGAQAALTAKYDEASAVLAGLQTETAAVKASLAEQGAKVDEGLADLRQAVAELRESERKRGELVSGCREEVETIRDLLPRMVDKQQEAQTSALGDLQQELKSLKSLLLSRRAAATTAPPSSTAAPAQSPPGAAGSSPALRAGSRPASASSAFAGLASRPAGIPAWQLASSSSAPSLASVGTEESASAAKEAPVASSIADDGLPKAPSTPMALAS